MFREVIHGCRSNHTPRRKFSDRLGWDGALDPRTLVVGDAIVRAYMLERQTSGGLITVSKEDAAYAAGLSVRGETTRAKGSIERFVRACVGAAGIEPFFARGNVIDVPWLLLRPSQQSPGELWAASLRDAHDAIAEFVNVWEWSMREFYAPSGTADPLDVSKHSAAGVRHASQCVQAIRGRRCPGYLSLDDIKAAVTRT